MSFAISTTDVPMPERNLVTLRSFSIIRIKFSEARLRINVMANSFTIDLCIIFMDSLL